MPNVQPKEIALFIFSSNWKCAVFPYTVSQNSENLKGTKIVEDRNKNFTVDIVQREIRLLRFLR